MTGAARRHGRAGRSQPSWAAMPQSARTVQVESCRDGSLAYLIDLSPESLPAVRPRDLDAAWQAARAAAVASAWGTVRYFRFRRADGGSSDLALADPDACCWAGAVDATVGMRTTYGVSLCLRLLALVNLLAHAAWAAGLVTLARDGAEIDPGLLAVACAMPLNPAGNFDEPRLRATLAARGGPLRLATSRPDATPRTPRSEATTKDMPA